MLLALLQGIIDGLATALGGLVSVLPTSPFTALNAVTMDSKWFGYLCYIVPIPQIVGLLQAWGTSILLFYVYMIFLRWAKAIE